ncbi:chloride channel protein [Anabaena sp. FACHB-1237]|uniref:chloride channel protein n=1 Tax=Anabaena sp. FACHB-1237 TaxID=2692769 RepID=UPI00168043CE|nr:chloride channel protein [Anabaena sp. FACHB-1237]MBD2138859.1 chloride channel protein [Anabaena sp. FACHB-1237]
MTLLPPPSPKKVKKLLAFFTPEIPINQLINSFQPSPETGILLLAILIGGSTGMGVVTFHYLIELIHHLMLEELMGKIGNLGAWTLAAVPIMGGLIVGLMRWRTQDFGPGLSSLIADTEGKPVKHKLRPVTKMIAAAVSLGSGASLGPEGPSVEIGTSFGVLLSDILQVSQERQRLLLGAGAAAGLAAGFNAPIAGVFFALEIVMGTTSFATSAVSVVLLAAVVAALIAQIGLGSQPAFALPAYQVRSYLELPLYLGLGLCASLISLTYKESIRIFKAGFDGNLPNLHLLRKIPQWFKPIIGGVIVGLVGWRYPQILGIGYGIVQAMLQDEDFSLNLLLILLVLKLLMTSISAGSGFVGGLFAPAMYLGASLGSAYAKILALIIPTIEQYMAAPPAYAMVGMAAVLAGSVRAPLTAIIMLFELTRDYRIVLPLMAAVGLSVWLVERIKPTMDSNSNLQQIGLPELKDEKVEIWQQMLVVDAMVYNPQRLLGSLGVLDGAKMMINQRSRSALIIDESNNLLGILSLEDIRRNLPIWGPEVNSLVDIRENFATQTLLDICTTDIIYAWEDEPLSEAIDRMELRGLHQLPVVARDNPNCILGLLEKEQIQLTCNLTAINKALDHYLPALPTVVN